MKTITKYVARNSKITAPHSEAVLLGRVFSITSGVLEFLEGEELYFEEFKKNCDPRDWSIGKVTTNVSDEAGDISESSEEVVKEAEEKTKTTEEEIVVPVKTIEENIQLQDNGFVNLEPKEQEKEEEIVDTSPEKTPRRTRGAGKGKK